MDKGPLPSSVQINDDLQFEELEEETGLQKFFGRLRKEPLIPLGCAATCYALYRAYRCMKVGDSVSMNKMFRARIYAQGFTLLAVVAGGIYYKNERAQRHEFERMLATRRSQEKRDAWLHELEVRDQEDREWRERHAAIGAAAKEAGKRQKPAATFETTAVPETQNDSVTAVLDAMEASNEKKSGGGILDSVKSLIWGKK
ncbi:Respiratory supercomplex factor 1, mitochondrial [Monascus purpureus]|uniref:Respiratory supercomplex factor 1, mitochondrial n=1 Tax=Monascus purpureus TaxID=5098 RepID=A0A507QT56_MONPU|nr:Respiratory supercomplex factor 1, mitochondrial [Monascus purpureus]BDD58590.1 Respiratory supercomplex factor 1,mitochondrial [Monascus purpureus]